MTKTRRNQPCPCGSGLKYKKCCGRLSTSKSQPLPRRLPEFNSIVERHLADERIRETQQGLGRPIVSFKAHDQQIVAVGNTVYYSPTWKTFPDFLCHYVKHILDPAWGNTELAKPFNERHPIIQWYDTFCRYQQETIKTPGVPSLAPITGVVASYLGLAYGLYLLNHNVELQSRFVNRLKNPGTFQGAYYEVMVANILIRAGFDLTLEDETDSAIKHCEFAAVSKRTGRKYWVEAKMRAVSGLLGKTDIDGTTNSNPISHLIPHLNSALQKPAADERLIFIDLNTEPTAGGGKPAWIEKVATRLEQYEQKELAAGLHAYVFITNMAFHRMLNETPQFAGVPFGVGIPDFNRPGHCRVSEAYRLKQKHIDAHHIGESLTKYTQLPTTFDGSLPSEAIEGATPRVVIGNTYFFENAVEGGLIGTVTSASVYEEGSEVVIALADAKGQSYLLREPMSPQQLADYRAHKDSYFGRILPVGGKITDPFELFEWFVRNHKWLSREQLLSKLATAPNFAELSSMSDEDLLYEYCELMVALFRALPNSPF